MGEVWAMWKNYGAIRKEKKNLIQHKDQKMRRSESKNETLCTRVKTFVIWEKRAVFPLTDKWEDEMFVYIVVVVEEEEPADTRCRSWFLFHPFVEVTWWMFAASLFPVIIHPVNESEKQQEKSKWGQSWNETLIKVERAAQRSRFE